jgi:thiamine pyrophosphokinase
VRSEGLAYPLQDEDLLFGPARGVSNVLIGSRADVRLEEGLLLAVHTPGRTE